ncbi:hypothetical protein AXF42_Ash014413 [Apostasia shenzhenica]|uniref:DUF3752 domain-containing protein n=1 Tax=Apostasia shenzhenica TaxID=1088818 RepID=A0A2I0B126_9ASPA|nr:hypothetical protein AXF42_Ash014413 [Apostasia shenzhenica]
MGKELDRRRPKSRRSSVTSSSSSPSSSSSDSERPEEKRRRRRLSHKSIRHREMSRHRTREEEHSKKSSRKRKRRQRRRSSSTSRSDDSFSSSAAVLELKDMKPEIILRLILEKFPDVANDLEQLLHLIDSGQGVDIRGISDKSFARILKKLFQSLSLEKNSKGVFLLPSNGAPTLKVIGSVLSSHLKSGETYVITPPKKQQESPSCPESKENQCRNDSELAEIEEKEESLVPPKRRFIGPEMPSHELLAAAAELTRAEAEVRDANLEVDNDLFIGPPPATLVTEVESANEAERFEEAELKALREAAEWRRISIEGDDELLTLTKEEPIAKRDEWMMELPPERKLGMPLQTTSFSKSGREGRGDASMWTDTPLDKSRKAKQNYLEAYNKARELADMDDKGKAKRSDADLVDKYNSTKRSKSLMQKHKEESQNLKKRSKKPEKEEWEGSHPWKPWDREKDLTAGRQKVNFDAESMAQGLSSRFSAGAMQRNFL